jgi:Tol biopolymer transport system component
LNNIDILPENQIEIDAPAQDAKIRYSFDVDQENLILNKEKGVGKFSPVTPERFEARRIDESPSSNLSCADSLTSSGNMFGQILFEKDRSSFGKEVWTLSSSGSLEQRLIENEYSNRSPDLSPDGSVLAFISRRENERALYISKLGLDKANKVASVGLDRNPEWSPDGSKIAFNSNGTIYTVQPNGEDLTKVTEEATDFSSISWNPSGSKIAFNRNDAEEVNIFTVDPDGTDMTQITEEGGGGPSWAPDGSRIAFISGNGLGSEIYTIKPDGTQLQQLEVNVYNPSGPTWSPDASQIAFSAGAILKISKINRRGMSEQYLTGSGSKPSWGIQKRLTPLPTEL